MYRNLGEVSKRETENAPAAGEKRKRQHDSFFKKTAILSISKTKKCFMPAYNSQEYGKVSIVTVKNSIRAINKLIKVSGETELLILHGDENEKLWKNNCKRITGISYKTALPVIEKMCRQVAEKYNIPTPFGEIYVMASPYVACVLTTCLSGLSKIFTIVSEESPLINAYDELYFKHGTIIRHLPEFNNNISEDSIIIRCSEDDLPLWARIPVIDFSNSSVCSDLCVNAANIYVSDESIGSLVNLWGGKSGLEFYEFMGEIPDADAAVDINIRADEIFLLDTESF